MALRHADRRLDVGDVRGAQRELEPLNASRSRTGSSWRDRRCSRSCTPSRGRLRLATALAAEVLANPDPPSRAHYLAQLARSSALRSAARTNGRPQSRVSTKQLSGSRSLRAADRAVTNGSQVARRSSVWMARPRATPSRIRALVALGVLEVLDTTGSLVTLGGPAEGAVRRAREALASHAHGAVIAAVEPWLRPGAPAVLPRTHIEASTLAAVARQAQGDRDRGERGTADGHRARGGRRSRGAVARSWDHAERPARASRQRARAAPAACTRVDGRRAPHAAVGIRRSPDRARAGRAVLPADVDVQRRDRAIDAPVGEHGQDAPQGAVSKAERRSSAGMPWCGRVSSNCSDRRGAARDLGSPLSGGNRRTSTSSSPSDSTRRSRPCSAA